MIYFLILLVLLFPSCTKSESVEEKPDFILRYADNQTADYPTTKAAILFSDLVYERTDGKIKILVYPEAKLGSENEVLEQVVIGGIDFSRFSLGTFADYIKTFEVLELPFLYRDAEHMWRVLDGEIGKYFMDISKSSGAFGLSWFDAGARSLYTRNKVNSLSELSNLRIRVQESDYMSSIVSALGATAIQIPYSDVYSSLQTLKIDGAENNFPSYVAMGHSEVAMYMLLDEHVRIPEIQVMSSKTYEKLYEANPAYIDIIKECATECALYERELWKQSEQDALNKMKENGVVLTPVSNEEKEYYKKKIANIYESRSEEEKAIIKAIQEL